jgi:nicotinamide-nucleotide amidase
MADALIAKAAELVARCTEQGLMVATAESCTGGMVAAAITEIAGSSAMMDRGFVTYSNEAKVAMLRVDPATIAHQGAVSGETALAMVVGALAASRADLAVSITGIAGPSGGSSEKPVGLVWFGFARRDREPRTERLTFDPAGGRAGIRHAAALHALRGLLALAKQGS